MIAIYQKTKNDRELRKIEKFKAGSWIYAAEPTEEDLLQLEGSLPVEADLLRDALDPYEVPRIEAENNVTYVFTRVPEKSGERIVTAPLLIVIGSDFVLTVSRAQLGFLDRFISGRADYLTTQKTLFVIKFFAEIVKSYNVFLVGINREVRSKSVQIEKVERDTIAALVNFEEILNDFVAALVPTNVALQRLLGGRYIKLYEQDQDLVEDLVLGTGQLVELSKATLKTIVNIREAYSTIVTNDLNRIIKLLTSLTVILAVPTMVASFYGMNVRLPFAEDPMAFLGIVVAVVGIAAVLLYIFGKKNWL